MLSQTVEYALRAIVWLAAHDDGQTTQAIAEGTKVPASYLSKVLQGLQRADLVQSRRGVGGGFALARSPRTIRVLDVVQAVDPIARIRTCPLGNPAHGTRLCPLHRRLDDAIASVERAFKSTTIQELAGPDVASRALCTGDSSEAS
ncbi:MAG: Rrf2 family transcriptional regulator [Deltaproteobacteria bacterium]|nr:Rrf2 family transcriptional regulator [Deltaproteobacteria bacterium]